MNTANTYSRTKAARWKQGMQWILLTGFLFAAAFGIFACKSDESSTAVVDPNLLVPYGPSSISIIPLNVSTLRILWTESDKRAFDGFVIQRKNGVAGAWNDIGKVGAAFRNYADSNLALDQYSYRVAAFNAAGRSRYSLELSVNTATVVIPPSKLAVSNVSVSHVELRWSDNSNNETGFYVQRTIITGGEGFPVTFIDSVGPAITSYIDNTAPCGAGLAYRVRAFNPSNTSAYSSPITVTVPFTAPVTLTTGVRAEMNSVANISATSAIAVGASGTILRTDNNGETWTKIKTAYSSTLNAVQVVTNTIFYAVGDRGRILRSNDGGLNWTLQPNSRTTALYAVSFFGPDTGYVCGENGLIMVTQDGGNSWNSIASGAATDLHAITFTSRKVGYCVGQSGVVLRTQNGGVNWGTLHTGLPNTFYSAAFISDSTGYIVGTSGIILRTTNMGVTWDTQHNPYGSDVLCVRYPSRGRAVISGAQTDLLYTINDGRTWVKIPIAGSATFLNAFTFAPDGSGFLVGGSGQAWRLEGCR